MVDLVIKNGTIATPRGVFEAGIAIKDGSIVGLGDSASFPEAQETLEATGLHVLPGLFDDHVHFRDPGLTYKEDFESGMFSRAHKIPFLALLYAVSMLFR